MNDIKDVLDKAGLIKENYLGNYIPAAAGVIFIIYLIITWSIYIIYNVNQLLTSKLIFLVTIIGTTGLVDDMAGRSNYKGFKGHFSQFFKGKLTTGFLKAVVTLVVFILIIDKKRSLPDIIISGGIFLLITNLLNLLDLRPARSLKVFILLSFLMIYISPWLIVYLVPFYLIILIYLPFELRGAIMLGDSGSNLLGAFLGYGFVTWNNFIAKSLLLVFLIYLTLFAEKNSFSKIIEKNTVLKWLDNLGIKY